MGTRQSLCRPLNCLILNYDHRRFRGMNALINSEWETHTGGGIRELTRRPNYQELEF
jgi:hypothetical protein